MPPEGSPYGRTKQSYTGRRRYSRAAANSTVLGFRRSARTARQRLFLNISAASADVVRLRRPSVSRSAMTDVRVGASCVKYILFGASSYQLSAPVQPCQLSFALLCGRAFQFGIKKFRFDSIRQFDKLASCTLIFK